MNKSITALAAATCAAAALTASALELVQEWDKTFPLSDKVEHSKVTFKNRFGIELAADVYKPKGVEGPLPAIAVSGPFGAVKEQVSGLYAQELAERGFLALAFDPSFTGESGGEPRNATASDISTEDFSAAVDYLTTRPDADPDHLGIVGICGLGGYALNAAALDVRIKATLASTMYDMNRVEANGYFDKQDTPADRRAIRERLAAARTADARSGKAPAAIGGVPEVLPEDAPWFFQGYHDYYKTPRGYHPRSVNSTDGFTVSSRLSLLNTPLMAYAGEIEGAVMVLHGENAHSRYFGEAAYAKLKGDNKELVIVPGADHCDLYDGGGKDAIPFDRIADFFRANLK